MLVLCERIVRITIQPTFTAFGRSDYWMIGGVRMFSSVLVWRTVAAKRRVALLASAKVHPVCADLYAFFANVLLWLFDVGYRVDVRADAGWHFVSLVGVTIG